MQNRPKARAVAMPRDQNASLFKRWMMGFVLGFAAVFFAGQVWAESHAVITQSHGFNEYGELKYGPDFVHLDYVNPDAPLGGEISLSANGTFDSMNPFATLSGTPGVLSSSIFERLMDVTSDEVGSYYCVLCTTIEYPEDRAWVIFNIRDDVTFSDGTPMTAHDVIYTHELLREQATPSYATYIKQLVPTYEVVDDYTVRFDFADDFPLRGRITQMGASLVMSRAWFGKTKRGLTRRVLRFHRAQRTI
jgi:microcin C transport system substrate-binding protein